MLDGTASSAWGSARVFDRLNSERFEAPSMVLGGSFWACVGFTFTGPTVNGAIIGQGDVDSSIDSGSDWFLQRMSTGKIRFSNTRDGGSGIHTVESSVTLVAGVEYHVAVWFSDVDNE
ncbi:MAG TPA: hypothetical protein DHW77_07250, partial [Verrucomicrobiales bacterium]|nr:hypothetical protein [Verrucomicrobiales bacterium]